MHAPENGKSTVLGLLKKHLPTRLAERLVPETLATRKVAQLAKKDREALALALHDHVVVPTRSEGMGHAEAAAGGVDTRDVNPRTLESRKRPGLYFAGEVLDVTGLLGGYNLHWAWASGKAVGDGVCPLRSKGGMTVTPSRKELPIHPFLRDFSPLEAYTSTTAASPPPQVHPHLLSRFPCRQNRSSSGTRCSASRIFSTR